MQQRDTIMRLLRNSIFVILRESAGSISIDEILMDSAVKPQNDELEGISQQFHNRMINNPESHRRQGYPKVLKNEIRDTMCHCERTK